MPLKQEKHLVVKMLSNQSVAMRGAVSALALVSMMPASAALASGPVTVAPEQIIVAPAPPVLSWAGFYGGISASRVSGGIDQNTAAPANTPDMISDTAFGAFVGYNWQRGNFVYGGELSYISFDTPFVGFPASFQQNAAEIRARAGYAVSDNVLFYGFVGAARSQVQDGGITLSQSGFSYGIGGQVRVRGGMFVGLELARRDVSGTYLGDTLGSIIDTASLRVGFQF